MSRTKQEEGLGTVTLFLKIGLTFGATLLLFMDDSLIASIGGCSPSLSLVSELCLGATFVASVVLVAVWDTALALLVCLFLVCWIAAIQKARDGGKGTSPTTQATQIKGRKGDTPTLRQASERVSQTQSAAVETQAVLDSTGPLLYSIDTPLPTPNEQTSIPMAYAMADRSYSTPALC